ncbi:hypothetical protein [Maribacter sp. 2-571]|uniref:hypothetical protein n=1 Tax=Maribacter sp. 2-571 TaxID=3417569 RepID=UPI003D32CCD6
MFEGFVLGLFLVGLDDTGLKKTPKRSSVLHDRKIGVLPESGLPIVGATCPILIFIFQAIALNHCNITAQKKAAQLPERPFTLKVKVPV